MKQKLLVAALATELNKTASGEIQLFPAGEFRAQDGRPTECANWLMTAELAQVLIAAADARTTPYVLDYEHQTLRAVTNGQPAPAAGWFKKLEWRDGVGLFAVDVVWTDAAAAMIGNLEYRYISPVFAYDKSGQVRKILHAALTNTPALDDMEEVVLAAASLLATASTTEGTTTMDELLERLRWMMNLPITATQADIIAELNKLIDQLSGSEAGTAAASFQTLSATPFNLIERLTTDASQLAALSVQVENPDPAKWVSVAVMQESINQAVAQVGATSVADLAAKECDGLITAALSDGRLLPAQEAWAKGLAKSNPDSLKGFLEKQPPIAALSMSQTGGKPPSGAKPPLSSVEDDEELDLAVCALMGTDPKMVAEFHKGKSNE
ncbi:TPA: phage protease [Serratia fonticola]|nr:phage protease [Serratia fonticola]